MKETSHPVHFDQLIGNSLVKSYLKNMLDKKAIGHSLLFSGPEGVGKSQFAWVLAAELFKLYDATVNLDQIAKRKHPDIHVLKPEGKIGLHSIQSLREFGEEVYFPPYQASWKVFIIEDAEKMYKYSANALLKTFEEPPPRTLIILVARSREALLPTIRSRCRMLHFQPIPALELQHFLMRHVQVEAHQAIEMTQQSEGSISRALRLVQGSEGTTRRLLQELLAVGKMGSHRLLMRQIGEIVAHIEKLKQEALEAAKEEYLGIEGEEISAAQKDALEKEIEGVASLVQAREMRSLLEGLYSWFRDIQLLSLGGSRAFLVNKKFEPALVKELGTTKNLSLDELSAALRQVELSFERSTSISICLENLFLRLNRV